MTATLVVKGGTVIDPASQTEKIASIIIADDKFVGICESGKEPEATEVIDATGCLVMPGLIDSHTHVFYEGTENGINPDITFLPMGVTAVFDQGSSGSGNFKSFYNSVIEKNEMHIFATLNISTQGLITSSYPENLTEKSVNLPAIKKLFADYGKVLKGIKVRISKEIVGPLELEPLKTAIRVAKEVHSRVVVHTTNPPAPVDEFIKFLGKSDIYAHCFSKKGYCILDDNMEIMPEVLSARERGVIFDSSDARVHYLYPVIKKAIKEGFYPDTISTDLVQGSVFKAGAFGLPRIMSKYLALGMPLMDVVRAVTIRAAEVLEEDSNLGAIKEGALADLAVFKYVDSPAVMNDREGNSLTIEKQLIPQCTVLKGKVVFRQFNF